MSDILSAEELARFNRHIILPQVVEFLQAQGYTRVKNLAGGILRWIDDVDPSLTKY